MIAITARHIAKSFGEHEVLKSVDFSVEQGARIGLVGVNGSGKSTLMRILAGLDDADSGDWSIVKDAEVGYLAQQDMTDPSMTIWETLKAVFQDAFSTENRLRSLEAEMADSVPGSKQFEQLSSEYDRLSVLYEEQDGYAWQSRVTGVLNGLGFRSEQYNRTVGSLSGGEITRLCLGRMLLRKTSVLLLDEPTNHLDMASLGWLESTLNAYPGTVILVSHDRYFLDHVCTGIIELIGGVCEQYDGNYTRYTALRQERYEARMRAYDLQQKEIARQKAIIARYRMFNREKSIRAAESREKRLNHMELLSAPDTERSIRLSFKAGKRTGEDVLMIDDLAKSFGTRELFRHLNLHIRLGDRTAIIGPNGIGKTTLLKLILKDELPDCGAIRLGANVQIGYYDQQQASLHPDKTVLDEVWDQFPQMEQSQIRGALGMFLFTEDDVFQPIHTLSGGEKGRVALTSLMLRHDNFLLLDEPTNHLDMDSREALEDALSGFDGTILTVSHDRYFINRIADHILEITSEGAVLYLGNYDDYLSKKFAPSESDATDGKINRTQLDKAKKRDRITMQRMREHKRRIDETEKAIMDAEGRIERLEAELASPALYEDPVRAKAVRLEYQTEKERLQSLYDLWEQLESEAE